MALRVAEEERRPPGSLWVGAVLPALAGVAWAATVGLRGLSAGPHTGDPSSSLLLWAGYALLVSPLFPLLTLWRAETWVSLSLLGTAITAGLLLVVDTNQRVPGRRSSATPRDPAWDALVGHTVLGFLLVLALIVLAVAIARRDGAPLTALGIVAVGAAALAAVLQGFRWFDLSTLVAAAPDWTGLWIIQPVVLDLQWMLGIGLVLVTLVVSVVGLIRAVRGRSRAGVVLFFLPCWASALVVFGIVALAIGGAEVALIWWTLWGPCGFAALVGLLHAATPPTRPTPD